MKKSYLFSALFGLFGLFILAGCSHVAPVEVPPGKVLLEEFADLQCPACKATHPLIKELESRFGADLIVHFVHFPLEQVHENAFSSAIAAECVRVQEGEDAFWDFVEEAYANQTALTPENLQSFAVGAGAEQAAFLECFENEATAARVRQDMATGRKRGVNSTPTLMINGEKIEDRRFESMAKKIQDLLDGATNTSDPEAEIVE